MKPITYISEQPSDYAKALDRAETLILLKITVSEYKILAEDAYSIVHEMDEQDFSEWRAGLKKERRGKFAGEQFSDKFGPLLMPETMLKASLVAHRFKVPWGLAYIRIRESQHG